MAKHTPGPWRLEIANWRGEGIYAVEMGSWRSAARSEADARLIASAPDMLAALEESTNELDDFVEFSASRDLLTAKETARLRAIVTKHRATIAEAGGKVRVPFYAGPARTIAKARGEA